MIDYFSFQAGTENPTLSAVLYTVLLAFLLSTAVAVTYYYTTPKSKKTKDFFHALILSSVVASTVMQAIGDSLAVGLGMLGALAIIRFRTNLENPRDIIFMFSTLAAGLACGVYGFVIALVGTVAFCITAWILRFTPLDGQEDLPAKIRFRLPKGEWDSSNVEDLLTKACSSLQLEEVRLRQEKEDPETGVVPMPAMEYNYRVVIKDEAAYHVLVMNLQNIPNIMDLRISVERAVAQS
ncbi:MAG: DUF4956 domain-containing protein [Bacteroidota bacterium]